MIPKLLALSEELGRTERSHADDGYVGRRKVEKCAAAKIEPPIVTGRTPHHVSWKPCFARAWKSPPDSARPLRN
jgi:hypothetical protein